MRQCYDGQLAAGDSVVIEKFVAYAWSQPQQEISDATLHVRAASEFASAIGAGFDALLQAQARDCAGFWECASLSIDHDRRSEQVPKFNLFHIFFSPPRATDMAASPRRA